MTQAEFTIRHDASREFLHLTISGLWDQDAVARFGAEIGDALREMIGQGARHGHILTLCDMRNKSILPQTVTTDFASLVKPGSPSKRIALLVAGALHRVQTRRLQNDPRSQVFDDEAEAMAWLMEEAETPIAEPVARAG